MNNTDTYCNAQHPDATQGTVTTNTDNKLINRLDIIASFNPHLTDINPQSPLSVGNGRFCYTADITGMQTLYEEYSAETPLCTMAEWGWHTKKADNEKGFYTLDDVRMTPYNYCKRTVTYPRVKYEGNEAAYDWVRQNPHKFNLAKIGLYFHNEPIQADSIYCINQTLDITTGILKSIFRLNVNRHNNARTLNNITADNIDTNAISDNLVTVYTVCDDNSDTVAFHISSGLLQCGLSINIAFPYASCDMTGSDWNNTNGHSDFLNASHIHRQIDDTAYYVNFNINGTDTSQHTANNSIITSDSNVTINKCNNSAATIKSNGVHCYNITTIDDELNMSVNFNKSIYTPASYDTIAGNSRHFWHNYWTTGKFLNSDNKELMRRVILSQYLLVINDSGYIPPAETGLTCNSWYGKAHLEMHYWHMAWAPLWGHPELLTRSFDWYIDILDEAKKNASRNGYKGARWTKMVSYTGSDCPSKIAPLLVWQQPHIINMLQMVIDNNTSDDFDVKAYMNKYWILVKETAVFIADYLVYDPVSDIYNIEAPVIPVQERHLPEDTRNPIFELAYFRFGLLIAAKWAYKLGFTDEASQWHNIAMHIAPLPINDDVYIAHSNCPDTFTNKAIDHPLMLQIYGMLDNYGAEDIVDKDIYRNTLMKVIDMWDYSTLWGWDFAVIAMAAHKLGLDDIALEQLLINSHKNDYVESGNNRQNSRKDLPLYLPGNGSLLLAAARIFNI